MLFFSSLHTRYCLFQQTTYLTVFHCSPKSQCCFVLTMLKKLLPRSFYSYVNIQKHPYVHTHKKFIINFDAFLLTTCMNIKMLCFLLGSNQKFSIFCDGRKGSYLTATLWFRLLMKRCPATLVLFLIHSAFWRKAPTVAMSFQLCRKHKTIMQNLRIFDTDQS